MLKKVAMAALITATPAVAWADETRAPAANEGSVWIGKARSIVLRHHLLTRHVLGCAALLYDAVSTPTVASVTAVERHGGHCGGDPNFASRIFTMTIDKQTGKAAWDHDTGDEMKPIP